MGKNRGSVIRFIRYAQIQIDTLKQEMITSPFDDFEQKGPTFMTKILSAESYSCTKCDKTIKRKDVYLKSGGFYHVEKSSISGGGSRFCGPLKEEKKDGEK